MTTRVVYDFLNRQLPNCQLPSQSNLRSLVRFPDLVLRFSFRLCPTSLPYKYHSFNDPSPGPLRRSSPPPTHFLVRYFRVPTLSMSLEGECGLGTRVIVRGDEWICVGRGEGRW